MPQTTILLYCEESGSAPLVEWLASLPEAAQVRCAAKLSLLEQQGYDLRRSHCDVIASTGLHELRVKHLRVNYRMLYFFHGQNLVVVSHGFSKEGKIPPKEIKLAQDRKGHFELDPELHTFRFQRDQRE